MNALPREQSTTWVHVCDLPSLIPDAGVAALVGDVQIALFCASSPEQGLWAVGNYDPIGGANVISRGIIGDINDEPVVSSPLYKQHFSLNTGVCLEDATHALPVYPVRLQDDGVWVSLQHDAD
ncbi:MAG: nitrite reductase small subunit NirD [Pseudomonadota bacterium]